MAQPPTPVKNDTHILKILNNMEKKHKIAIESFQTAERQDLVDKEQSQLEIVKQYASQVPILTPKELNQIVEEAVAQCNEDDVPVNMEMDRPVLSSDIAAAARKFLAK
ncbi:hypothetical protein AA313_de0209328 [Arthrobotrys entomopaga]|nr:hypothetical protein AA313_de0209328 [Arthrobotrys entomopaga]